MRQTTVVAVADVSPFLGPVRSSGIHTHQGESRHITCLRVLMDPYWTVKGSDGQESKCRFDISQKNIGWPKTTLWKLIKGQNLLKMCSISDL